MTLTINVSYDASVTDLKTSNLTLYNRYTGAVQTAVQNFDSLEKAREFAQDLGCWQQRQHQMRDGAAVVVADQF